MSGTTGRLTAGATGSGRIDFWDAKRGYGFVVAGTGERLFLHISELARVANDPRVGDQVSFVVGFGRDGRLAARRGRIIGANLKSAGAYAITPKVPKVPKARAGWRSALATVMLVAMLFACFAGAALWPLLAYGALGAASFALYAKDKADAIGQRWRVPELYLHGLDLCGGVIGGLFAQDVLRHKTSKQSFAMMTLIIAGTHLIWLVGVALGRVAWPDVAML